MVSAAADEPALVCIGSACRERCLLIGAVKVLVGDCMGSITIIIIITIVIIIRIVRIVIILIIVTIVIL